MTVVLGVAALVMSLPAVTDVGATVPLFLRIMTDL